MSFLLPTVLIMLDRVTPSTIVEMTMGEIVPPHKWFNASIHSRGILRHEQHMI